MLMPGVTHSYVCTNRIEMYIYNLQCAGCCKHSSVNIVFFNDKCTVKPVAERRNRCYTWNTNMLNHKELNSYYREHQSIKHDEKDFFTALLKLPCYGSSVQC